MLVAAACDFCGADAHVRLHADVAGAMPAPKMRTRALATTLVYPLAWSVARLGLGPELMVYARKR